jgi:hypothetical protein
MPNLITWDIDNNLLDLSGLDTSLQDKLTVPVPSQQTFRLGFYRGSSGDTRRYLDLGSDPSIEFLVKPATGNNRFDVAPVVASPVFTRQAVDDLGDYYYEGSIDFSAPPFIKALGINHGYALESISIECVANTNARLNSKYLDIYENDTDIHRLWFETTATTGNAPSGGASITVQKVTIANNATAAQVATAIETAMNATISGMTTSVTGGAVNLQFPNYEDFGSHDSQTSGFTITTLTAGSAPAFTTDVTSASYNGQLVYLDGTAPQISPIFTLEIVNSLYRDGQTFPAGTGSSNYRDGSVTLSASDSATVTFSSALTAATYDIISLEVIYTGSGSPGLKLTPCTIDDKATTGFTVYLNGDATTDYRLDYKVTL